MTINPPRLLQHAELCWKAANNVQVSFRSFEKSSASNTGISSRSNRSHSNHRTSIGHSLPHSLRLRTLQTVSVEKLPFTALTDLGIFSRNDRRVRYLTDTFNSFFPSNRTKNVSLNTTDHSDEATLNTTVQSKLDVSSVSTDQKFAKMNNYESDFVPPAVLKHVNINERRDSLEKQIFIENLKTCPSPYSSYRRSERKFNSKEQLADEPNKPSNIYSQDPLGASAVAQAYDNHSLLYEDVDLHQTPAAPQAEDVIYDVIHPGSERPVPPANADDDDESNMYATPKNI